MTAADEELRRMLDERNVEYKERDMYTRRVFHWGEPLHSAMFTASNEWTELVVENPTPQQAIDATLGRGECEVEERNDGWYCSACGDLLGSYDLDSECFIDGNVIEMWDYCPYCGKKVKQ